MSDRQNLGPLRRLLVPADSSVSSRFDQDLLHGPRQLTDGIGSADEVYDYIQESNGPAVE